MHPFRLLLFTTLLSSVAMGWYFRRRRRSPPPAVHGGWSSWGGWGACNKPCGNGLQYSSRYCNNPTPSNGGRGCSGSSSRSQLCNRHGCPVHGGWSSWGPWPTCSKTCGGATQIAFRHCNNPAPRYGGRSCSGINKKTQICNTRACPVHGAWGSWGPWSKCPKTCGGATQSALRSCNKPLPMYGGRACSGSSIKNQRCNTQSCPVHGVWSNWGAWSTCPKTCGGATQGAVRSCNNPAPRYGGRACSGSNKKSQRCNTQNCPVDGGWASWEPWSFCTTNCGGGVQHKRRLCSNPKPLYGGKECSGSGSKTQTCNNHNCEAPAVWSNWGSWSTCPVTCGGGLRFAKRKCSKPPTSDGKKSCKGTSTKVHFCNDHSCPDEDYWN